MRSICQSVGVALGLVVLGSPALADWHILHPRDPMTDRVETVGTLVPTQGTGSVGLIARCLNGTPSALLFFLHPILPVRTDAAFRFDNGPVVPRSMPVSQDGQELWLWLGVRSPLNGHSRLRVTIFPVGRPQIFVDFDLRGAPEIRCK